MLGVTILASLPESVGEISVDEKTWNREVQWTDNGEYCYLYMFSCKELSLAQIT
jgi:hypothetical protein